MSCQMAPWVKVFPTRDQGPVFCPPRDLHDGERGGQFLQAVFCHGMCCSPQLHTHKINKCNKNAFKAYLDKAMAQIPCGVLKD